MISFLNIRSQSVNTPKGRLFLHSRSRARPDRRALVEPRAHGSFWSPTMFHGGVRPAATPAPRVSFVRLSPQNTRGELKGPAGFPAPFAAERGIGLAGERRKRIALGEPF